MFVRVEVLLGEGRRPGEFTARVNRSAEIGDAFRTYYSRFSSNQEKSEARLVLASHGRLTEVYEARRRLKNSLAHPKF